MTTVRASFCKHDDHRPATEEVAFVGQNTGPGVSVVACRECAGLISERASSSARRTRRGRGSEGKR